MAKERAAAISEPKSASLLPCQTCRLLCFCRRRPSSVLETRRFGPSEPRTVFEIPPRPLRLLDILADHDFSEFCDHPYDQGKEIARHQELEKRTGIRVYFADPHSAGRGQRTRTPMVCCDSSSAKVRTYPDIRDGA